MDTKQKLLRCHICNEGVGSEWHSDSRYLVCDKCGSLWMCGRVKAVYNQEYYSRGKIGNLMKMVDKFSFWDRYLTLGLKKTDRVLEIGFGEGKFLKDLERRGYQVCGVEKSKYAREKMVKILGEDKVFDDIDSITEKFEVVVMYHVLEHVDEPEQYLKSVKKLLVTSGRLVVRVPNVDSWETRLAGSDWYHLEYPNHQTLFSEAGLIRLFERSGLANIVSRNFFGEYRQVLGYSILTKLGIKLDKWMMIAFQIVTIPFLWVLSIIVGQHGVIEVEGHMTAVVDN